MDKQFFLNAGMLPHFQFNQSAIPTWRSFSPMETQSSDLHFPAPALTSPISVSNSELSNKRFVIKELIGKLDNVCNSGEISPPEKTPVTSHTFPVPPFGSSLPAIPVDPGFADRATRLSYFGSRSFSGKTGEFVCPTSSDSTQLIVGEKLHKVCSSPTIDGSSTVENKNPENSLGLEHTNPVGEIGSRPGNDGNSFSRKRKSLAKGKCNEIPTSPSTKVIENGEISNAKRSKFTEDSNNENKKQTGNNTDQKSAEPPKDYIHVRARRGQATDSHSLAERVRREKISERMKLLQDIVPGCNKVTGKALMLEEIINYVQSLQRQVEFLSMKLSTVSPRVDFNTNNLFHKDVYRPNCSLQTHPKYPLDTFTTCNYDANPLEQISITRSGMGPPCSNPTNPLNQTNGILLPTIDGLNNGVSKLCEGDLHTIVQMGFGQNTKSHQDNTFQNQFLQDQIRYLQ